MAGSTQRDTDSLPSRGALAGTGAVGGLAGAMLGGGTGTVTVPVLDRITELRRGAIHATAAMPNVVVAVIGACAYGIRGGAVDLGIAIPMMIGGVLGVRGGARFVARASPRMLRAIFVVVLVLAGLQLLLEGLGLDPFGAAAALPPVFSEGTYVTAALALTLGVLVGAWSAAMGLGGGLLTVPVLVLLFGTGMQTALGTSLAVMVPNSILSSIAHIRRGTAVLPVGLGLAAGAVPGAVVGVFIALALPGRALSLVFGGFVLVMAFVEVLRARRGG